MKYFKFIAFTTVTLLLTIVFIRGHLLSAPSPSSHNRSTNKSISINESKALANYSKAIRFKTVSSETEKINIDQFAGLQTFLKNAYPNVFKILKVKKIGTSGLLLQWQGTNHLLKPVLFMAHQDVVPIAPGTEKDWQQPPFSGTIADGYVWGRGTMDCKASLTAILAATSQLIEKHFTPARTIYFYFGDDEESGGKTAALASQYLEKQGVHFEYIIDEAGMISNGLFPKIISPVALIAVTEKGWLNLKLTAHTAGGHSSIPPKELAIGKITKAIDKLLDHPFPSHIRGVTKQLLETLSTRKTFYDRVFIANTWLFEPMIIHQLNQTPLMSAFIHTTQAPTILNAGIKSNVLPQHASAIINFRIDPYDTVDSVITHVRNTINDPSIDLNNLMSWEPSPISSTSSAGYKLLANTINEVYGDNVIVSPFVLTGATDSRRFTSIADNIYRFFPITVNNSDLTRFHGTNERYAINDYLKMIGFYYILLLNQSGAA